MNYSVYRSKASKDEAALRNAERQARFRARTNNKPVKPIIVTPVLSGSVTVTPNVTNNAIAAAAAAAEAKGDVRVRATIHDAENHGPPQETTDRCLASRSEHGGNDAGAAQGARTASEVRVDKGTSKISPPAPSCAAEVRRGAPIHDNSHRKHAHCGRVCLPASLFSEFVRRRNHADADREISDWALEIEREWSDGPRASDEPGDPFEFWKARYSEKWPSSKVDSRVPAWAR